MFTHLSVYIFHHLYGNQLYIWNALKVVTLKQTCFAFNYLIDYNFRNFLVTNSHNLILYCNTLLLFVQLTLNI